MVHAIIVCFSYQNISEYKFKIDHINSDLRRILLFVEKSINADKTTIITDFHVDGREYIKITSSRHFNAILKDLFSSNEEIFFYMSAHAIRQMSSGNVKHRCLV